MTGRRWRRDPDWNHQRNTPMPALRPAYARHERLSVDAQTLRLQEDLRYVSGVARGGTELRGERMKLCTGSHEEVRWCYISQTKCRVCKHFVNYKSVEQTDGWVDIATRHYPNGTTPNAGPREGYHQFRKVPV